MIKILSVIFLMVIATFSFGQRLADMSVVMTYPTASTVLKSGEPFTIYFSCINNGQDPVMPKDSIIFYMSVNDTIILNTKRIFHASSNITSTNGQAFFVQNLTLNGSGGPTKLCTHVIVMNRQLPDSVNDISLSPFSNNASCVTMKLSGSGIGKIQLRPGKIKVSPNPCTSNITIGFTVNSVEKTSIEILDMQGRLVKTIDYGLAEIGYKSVDVNLTGFAKGVYICKVNTGNTATTDKFIVE